MKKFTDWKYDGFGLYEGVTVPLEQPLVEFDDSMGLLAAAKEDSEYWYLRYINGSSHLDYGNGR